VNTPISDTSALGVKWITSTYSGGNNNCLQAAILALPANPSIAVRDSKTPSGPALVFPATTWQAFVSGVSQSPVAIV
jgi:hypothetical protein